jgi:cell division protein FtsI/penicillin-binding protein 2
MLNRDFPSHRIEYLLLDLNDERTIAVRWPQMEKPIPAGSLLKPFVALAFDDLHSGSSGSGQRFPAVQCHGKSDGCWRNGGHGLLTLEPALAESCNAYFLSLAKALAASDAGMIAMGRVSAAYGLPAPPALGPASGGDERRMARMLIGVTREWLVTPAALAHAYAALASNSRSDAAARLLAGMRLAAGRDGTAAKVGGHPGGVLAKTGTAPCVSGSNNEVQPCVANGDGLVVVLTPAGRPRLLLLVRERGTTGAQAAEVAGRMLSRLEANARAQ